MKNGLLAVLLTSALVSAAGAATVPMSPPSAEIQTQGQPKVIGAPAKSSLPARAPAQAKADCPCNCPPKSRRDADARPANARHHFAYRAMRRHARAYHYAAAAPVVWRQWSGPMSAPGNEVEGLSIEDRGWTGGVGYASDGGGGGGSYGQSYFANGGSVENGPSYNSYGQSFQFNPSQAGPFQPRLMGGFAPSSGSR